MRILSILSSHYPGSFNQVLMERFQSAAETNGHTNDTTALYETKFNPVMAGDDFNQFSGKPLPADVNGEIEKVHAADLMTFFFPVWWCGMPAIMKGWIDRVLAKGVAYDYGADGASGLLSDKQVLIVATFGNAPDSPGAATIDAAMRVIFDQGTFGYCGIETVRQEFLYDVYRSEDDRNRYLSRMDELAASL